MSSLLLSARATQADFLYERGVHYINQLITKQAKFNRMEKVIQQVVYSWSSVPNQVWSTRYAWCQLGARFTGRGGRTWTKKLPAPTITLMIYWKTVIIRREVIQSPDSPR